MITKVLNYFINYDKYRRKYHKKVKTSEYYYLQWFEMYSNNINKKSRSYILEGRAFNIIYYNIYDLLFFVLRLFLLKILSQKLKSSPFV